MLFTNLFNWRVIQSPLFYFVKDKEEKYEQIFAKLL